VHKDVPGVKFLTGAVSYVRDQLGLDGGDFLYEMCEGIRLQLSGSRPDAPTEREDRQTVHPQGNDWRASVLGDFDLYAVEGGTAAMTYLFNSPKVNHLINPGDTIALGPRRISKFRNWPNTT
jgi:aspartate 4-decarboxylase